MILHQWVIVQDNCETYVTWAETKEKAIEEYRQKGGNSLWRILKKGKVLVPDLDGPQGALMTINEASNAE